MSWTLVCQTGNAGLRRLKRLTARLARLRAAPPTPSNGDAQGFVALKLARCPIAMSLSSTPSFEASFGAIMPMGTSPQAFAGEAFGASFELVLPPGMSPQAFAREASEASFVAIMPPGMSPQAFAAGIWPQADLLSKSKRLGISGDAFMAPLLEIKALEPDFRRVGGNPGGRPSGNGMRGAGAEGDRFNMSLSLGGRGFSSEPSGPSMRPALTSEPSILLSSGLLDSAVLALLLVVLLSGGEVLASDLVGFSFNIWRISV